MGDEKRTVLTPEADTFASQTTLSGCLLCPKEKKIYLTFDDGIQPGTEEVYSLLKRRKMRGTFFMTGAHVWFSETYTKKGILKKIYDDKDFLIGNHSTSHANSHYYTDYYDNGGVALNTGEKRSVLDDFKRCDKILSELLGLSSYIQFPHARLPGRNTWRVKGMSDKTKFVRKEYGNWRNWGRDSMEEADALKENGYQVYGWDLEWEMDFKGTDAHSDYDPEVDPLDDKEYALTQHPLLPHSTTRHDSYRHNFDLDRPKMTAVEVANKIKSMYYHFWETRKSDKLILLVHERAFRYYKDSQKELYLSEFEKFLDLLVNAGIETDLISNY